MFKRKECLIIGCGRSGTTLVSALLQSAGLDIPHEKSGSNGSVNWFKTSLPRFYLQLRFKYLLYQTRNPLECMSSCQTIADKNWRKIARHIPLKDNDVLPLKCAKYWYYWNKMAEKKAHLRYRIEDIREELPALLEFVGLTPSTQANFNLLEKAMNSRKDLYEPIGWEQIEALDADLCKRSIKLAEAYGYPIVYHS